MSRPERSILLVEDDPSLRELIGRMLSGEGYRVQAARSGSQGLAMARRRRPDLILSDWVLGHGPAGVALCARLKSRPETRALPIIIMTGAKVAFEDELCALRSGADLYLTKSGIIGPDGLTPRFLRYVESLLERPPAPARSGPPSARAELRIDPERHTVKTRTETIVDLPTKLFDVLCVLARQQPRCVSRKYLVRYVWKGRVRDREADVAVSRLKNRIETGKARYIESVFGKGYRLTVPASIGAGALEAVDQLKGRQGALEPVADRKLEVLRKHQ